MPRSLKIATEGDEHPFPKLGVSYLEVGNSSDPKLSAIAVSDRHLLILGISASQKFPPTPTPKEATSSPNSSHSLETLP